MRNMCQRCGNYLPEESHVCPACNPTAERSYVRRSQRIDNPPMGQHHGYENQNAYLPVRPPSVPAYPRWNATPHNNEPSYTETNHADYNDNAAYYDNQPQAGAVQRSNHIVEFGKLVGKMLWDTLRVWTHCLFEMARDTWRVWMHYVKQIRELSTSSNHGRRAPSYKNYSRGNAAPQHNAGNVKIVPNIVQLIVGVLFVIGGIYGINYYSELGAEGFKLLLNMMQGASRYLGYTPSAQEILGVIVIGGRYFFLIAGVVLIFMGATSLYNKSLRNRAQGRR